MQMSKYFYGVYYLKTWLCIISKDNNTDLTALASVCIMRDPFYN